MARSMLVILLCLVKDWQSKGPKLVLEHLPCVNARRGKIQIGTWNSVYADQVSGHRLAFDN